MCSQLRLAFDATAMRPAIESVEQLIVDRAVLRNAEHNQRLAQLKNVRWLEVNLMFAAGIDWPNLRTLLSAFDSLRKLHLFRVGTADATKIIEHREMFEQSETLDLIVTLQLALFDEDEIAEDVQSTLSEFATVHPFGHRVGVFGGVEAFATWSEGKAKTIYWPRKDDEFLI